MTEARVVPAGEIDEQFARDEGEGFESVEDWRVAHEHFFGRELDARDADRRGAVPRGGAGLMRVWIDMTAPAHVLVFKPLVEIMRERGDEVEITARDYAQTVELLALHGLKADAVIGRTRAARACRRSAR